MRNKRAKSYAVEKPMWYNGGAMNQNRSLINRSAVRDYTLAVLAQRRPHLVQKFSRIGRPFFDRMEGHMRDALVEAIDTLPSKGKTIN